MKMQTSKARIFVLAMLLSPFVFLSSKSDLWAGVRFKADRLAAARGMPRWSSDLTKSWAINNRFRSSKIYDAARVAKINNYIKRKKWNASLVPVGEGIKYRSSAHSDPIMYTLIDVPNSFALRRLYANNNAIDAQSAAAIVEVLSNPKNLNSFQREAVDAFWAAQPNIVLTSNGGNGSQCYSNLAHEPSILLEIDVSDAKLSARQLFLHEGGHLADSLLGRYPVTRHEIATRLGTYNNGHYGAFVFYDEMRQNYRATGNWDQAYELTSTRYFDFGSGTPLQRLNEAKAMISDMRRRFMH